ncbi:MAG: TonB-dependent receptor [Alphaproteobacteria bacterium]|nr:TonB-dependent receptor [Alphaproteobacteria bacterium]MBU1516422.1 TonB-dependent receptor [Alphaproteobacteria bacterium]MBU2093341.1 TonB-dependent receptor [Alphaproteobacteria bacterium]MBU2153828.1 TonB-dependent receptor [Alphaproteobacteria bacterium]MBU2307700.1 TonB-dependent receptor [Alphaproteobacteria bacterium]
MTSAEPWRLLVRIGLAGGLWLAATAAYAEPAHILRLPAEPVDRALVRFGVQAGVSVGGFPVAGCTGESRPVIGVLTASTALRRLLPPGCTFERIDEKAFRIAAQRVPPAPHVAPTLAPAPTTNDLDEVVVTAEKRREPLRGSPFAVSVVTTEDLERLGASDFADAALQFPGVAETNLGPGRNKIFIRGISDGAFTGRTQSTVGLYLDDVQITYNAPDPDLRLADVKQVEVLRGPQGTLYGSGSIGGIVRMVTAPPDPTAFAAAASVEGMINEHKDRSFSMEAMLNAPLLEGKAAVRAVVYRDELAGYLDNPRLGLEDVNRGRRTGGRVAARIELPGGWQAQANVVRQALNTSDSQYTQGGARLTRDAAILEPHDNDFTLIGGTLAHPGSMVDLRVSAAYIDHDLTTRYDATGAFDLAPGALAAFDEAQVVELWVGEAVAASAGQTRLRWLVGLFGSLTHDTSSGLLDARLSGGASRSVFQRRDRLQEAAVFGELTYDLTPRITATLGGRLFATRVETRSGGFGLARPPLPDIQAHLTDEGFAPKARLSYAFAPGLVAYAQVQDGYRAGGFDVPAAADGATAETDVGSYRPDRLRSYEVGGEATLFDGALTVRGALFTAIWRNVQTDQFRPSGLPVTLNIGDGSNRGVEFEAVWKPDAHWRLRVSGLVDEPELTRTSDQFPAQVDIGLPGVAKHTAAVDVSYGWNLPHDLKAEVSAQASYVGRSFLTFDGGAATAMGDYGQGRIAATVKGARWQAQAYVANVTDEEGNTFAYGNPFSRMRARQATPLPPRTFGLALRRSF